jgi:acyl-coenzyme A synthetase/AMP-(fatty) acid ligase
MRRTLANLAVGMVAGAAMVGLPTYAVAAETDGAGEGHRHEMGEMMSGEDCGDMMSEMMKDPEHREQMRSMMSGAMKDGAMKDMATRHGDRMSTMGQ